MRTEISQWNQKRPMSPLFLFGFGCRSPDELCDRPIKPMVMEQANSLSHATSILRAGLDGFRVVISGICFAIIFTCISLLHFVGCAGGVEFGGQSRNFMGLTLATILLGFCALLVSITGGMVPFANEIADQLLIGCIGLIFITQITQRLLFSPSKLADIDALIATSPIHLWFARRLRHRQDAIWFPWAIVLSILAAALLLAVMLGGPQAFALAILYVYLVCLTNGRIDAFEHACGHYRPLERSLDAFDKDPVLRSVRFYCRYVLPVVLSRIPFWYEVEHNAVHHAEDNDVKDLQSTVIYDRASVSGFLRCATRFVMNGVISIELVGYLVAKGRLKPLRKVLSGLLIFYGVVVVAWIVAPLAAGAVLLGRVIGLALSATSFYREHGMVDIDQPANVWRNSLTFLDPDCDHGALGDDLHVEHHLRPGVHWSAYNASLHQNRLRYAKEQALGFVSSQGGIREYYAALWSADFVRLARLFVLVGSPYPESQDIVNLLRERSRPLVVRPHWQWARAWDRWAGSSLSRLIPRFVD